MRKALFLAALCAALAMPAHGTLTTTTSVIQYTSNGVTTVFSFPYRFLDNSHLVVQKTVSAVTSTLVLGTDYTVTGAGLTAGGTVTLTAAIPNGATLKISRSTPKTQPTNLRQGGQPQQQSAAIETALDRLEMQAQEMNDGTFTSLVTTPITTAQASVAAPSSIPNSANTNVAGSSAAFAAADHIHSLAVGPMAGANTAAGQSITNGTTPIVVFGTEERDTDSAYDNSTGRFTVPTGKGGDYEVLCEIAYGVTMPTGLVAVYIFKNAAQQKIFQINTPAANVSLSVVAILNLAAGDIVDCRTAHNEGSAKVLAANAALNFIAIKRIQ